MAARNRKRSSHKKRSKRSKRSSNSSSSISKLILILDLLLRLLIYPVYVAYVFLKTILIVKPKEILFSIKEKLSYSYFKSKKYYRKAKKFTLQNQYGGSKGKKDGPVELSVYEDDSSYNPKKQKRVKGRFFKKLVMKFFHLIKKIWLGYWKLFIKIKGLKKYILMKIKWTIKKFYEMWIDTERIIFKLKGLPFLIIDKTKTFLKEAIEEPDNQSYDYEITTRSRPPLPEPIRFAGEDDTRSLEEIVITKTVTTCPSANTKTIPISRPASSRAGIISRGRPQTRQSRFSERIDGTLPGRKYFAPPTNEELIDDYFNTFDAIQPHESHRDSVRRRRSRRVITDEDVDAVVYVPEIQEHPPPSSRAVVMSRNTDDKCDYIYEGDHKKHVSYDE